jgi:hypothetical protein
VARQTGSLLSRRTCLEGTLDPFEHATTSIKARRFTSPQRAKDLSTSIASQYLHDSRKRRYDNVAIEMSLVLDFQRWWTLAQPAAWIRHDL